MNIRKTFHPLFRTLREMLIPDLGELALSFLAALIIYVIVSFDFFLSKISGDNPELKHYSYDLFSDTLSKLSHLPQVENISLALVWGVIGIVVYIIFILVLNFFITAKNNATVNSSLTHEPDLLAFSLLDEYRRIVWIVALIGLLCLSLPYLFPFWVECFHKFNYFHNPAFLIGGLLGMMLNLYLIYACILVTIRNPKLME